MAAHPERLHLQQRRPLPRAPALSRPPHRVDHGEHVVAVHDLAVHPVACRRVGDVLDRHRLPGRRREAVAVVLDHEQNGQLPDGREVERLVEIPLARGPLADERARDEVLSLELRGEAEARRDGKHSGEVRDHPHDAVLHRAEVEGAVTAVREAALLPHELAEQPVERDAPRRPDPEVAVHREDDVVRVERPRTAHGDGLLPIAGEPLREAVLADQPEHLPLDGAGKLERAVERGGVEVEVRRGRRGVWGGHGGKQRSAIAKPRPVGPARLVNGVVPN